jgi:hypothetical protein
VLGYDQTRRLVDAGIDLWRIRMKPDPSPVAFKPGIVPMALPEDLRGGAGVILYSGNWGVAHDDTTFVEGYTKYVLQSNTPMRFWLNATGAKADRVETALRSRGVPLRRSTPVPLDDLPGLLSAADVHLITLRDPFVGYVLPSKIHACIESKKPILFIGSERSDVHRLASCALPPSRYWRVDSGDAQGLTNALHAIECAMIIERQTGFVPSYRRAVSE